MDAAQELIDLRQRPKDGSLAGRTPSILPVEHDQRPNIDHDDKGSPQSYEAEADLVPVAPKNHLGYLST